MFLRHKIYYYHFQTSIYHATKALKWKIRMVKGDVAGGGGGGRGVKEGEVSTFSVLWGAMFDNMVIRRTVMGNNLMGGGVLCLEM